MSNDPTRMCLLACVVLFAAGATAVGQDPNPAVRPPDRKIEAAPRRPAPKPSERFVPDAGALAQVQIDPEMERCLERLGHPVYGVREAAMGRMIAGDFSKQQLYAVLETRTLTAEQRHRLLTVVRDRLLNMPRGAVGIKVDQRFLPNEIRIMELLPGLPAGDVLQIGDRITHIDGVELGDWAQFVDAVQSESPGTKIKVSIVRPVSDARPRREVQPPKYEMLDIELELGSAELLTDPNTGRLQRSGPVWDRRKAEADNVINVWGPRPKPVEIDGG